MIGPQAVVLRVLVVLSPVQPGSRSSTWRRAAARDFAAFSSLVLVDSHFRVLRCARPSQRQGYRFAVLLSLATVFSSPQVVLSAVQVALTQRVTESCRLHYRRLQDFFHSRRRGSMPAAPTPSSSHPFPPVEAILASRRLRWDDRMIIRRAW